MRFKFLGFFIIAATLLLQSQTPRPPQQITLATTTSTLDSGLLDELIPAFEKKENCRVKVIAVGTGQAIKLAADGNADVILVHDRKSEEKFVRDGYGTKRFDVMYNDFVVVGPTADSSSFSSIKTAVDGFAKIMLDKSPFVSRGDNSGTHKKELEIWEKVKQSKKFTSFGIWYIESGAGMEQALRIANEKNAYCLTDRGTWLAHKSELLALKIALKGGSELRNPYSVIPVSPARFPWVNYSKTREFVKFITGKEGQEMIKRFGVTKYGQPLFYPSAK